MAWGEFMKEASFGRCSTTNAEIVAVGTELLLGQIVNTNAKYLSENLALLGINMYFQTVVGDNPGRMASVFRQAMDRADVIMVTGGLGPTMDDITKEVLAEVLGKRLSFDPVVWEEISQFFLRRNTAPTENNKRQAYIIEDSIVLDNPFGTAPGVQCTIQVAWPEVQGADGAAVPGGTSSLVPAMTLYGLDPDFLGIHYLEVDSKGMANAGHGYVWGDTLLTTTACVDMPGKCQRVTRINAHPDGKLVETRIDIEVDARRQVRFMFVQRRMP